MTEKNTKDSKKIVIKSAKRKKAVRSSTKNEKDSVRAKNDSKSKALVKPKVSTKKNTKTTPKAEIGLKTKTSPKAKAKPSSKVKASLKTSPKTQAIQKTKKTSTKPKTNLKVSKPNKSSHELKKIHGDLNYKFSYESYKEQTLNSLRLDELLHNQSLLDVLKSEKLLNIKTQIVEVFNKLPKLNAIACISKEQYSHDFLNLLKLIIVDDVCSNKETKSLLVFKSELACEKAFRTLTKIKILKNKLSLNQNDNHAQYIILSCANFLKKGSNLNAKDYRRILIEDFQSFEDHDHYSMLTKFLSHNPFCLKVIFCQDFSIKLKQFMSRFFPKNSFVTHFSKGEEAKVTQHEHVNSALYSVDLNKKFLTLLNIIKKNSELPYLIFANTEAVSRWIAFKLQHNHVPCEFYFEERADFKNKRKALRKSLDDKKIQAVVTREKPFLFYHQNLNNVINFDLPESFQEFQNRMTHLDRNHNSSSLTSFICEDYGVYTKFFESYFGKLKVKTFDSNEFSFQDNSPYPLEKNGKVKHLKTYLELQTLAQDPYKHDYKVKGHHRDRVKEYSHSKKTSKSSHFHGKGDSSANKSIFSKIGNYLQKCFKKFASFFNDK